MSYKRKSVFYRLIQTILTFSLEQLNRVNLMHASNNIIISAKTHAGRKYTVKNIRDNRASRSEAKAVGRWSESGNGAYDRYDRSLPIEGMLAAASFNGQKPESYMIPRNCLGTPSTAFSFAATRTHMPQRAASRTCRITLPLGGGRTGEDEGATRDLWR